MKKIVLVIGLILLLTGCIYQGSFRPQPDSEDIWVCENPKAELYWENNIDFVGKISYKDFEQDIVLKSSPGSLARICDIKSLDFDLYEDKMQFWLLECRANYKKDAFDLTVEEDLVNMFGGEKPKLHFEKRNKAEYLKEIGEEP